MKLVKIVSLLTVGIAISISSSGCKKGLDKTTQIPGRGVGSISDTAAPPRTDIGRSPNLDNTPPILGNTTPANTTSQPITPTPETGIPPTDGGTFDGWTEDRETFKNQTVLFDFDKSVVKASEIPKLEEVARRLKAEFVGKALRIEGHCDERGTEEYNRALGDRRALSVREKLSEMGVDPKILPTISFGEERPAQPGHDEAAWKANRRGELILLTRPN